MDVRRISLDLIGLTEALAAVGHEVAAGVLGGEYGYGAVFENAMFAMHPYCWCEQDTCPWCNVCLCGEDSFIYLIDGKPAGDWGAWLDAPNSRRSTQIDETKQCVRCRTGQEAAPNFLHKPSGTTVRWYKYIGRGMGVDLRGDWDAIITECRNSLIDPSTPSAPASGAAAHDPLCLYRPAPSDEYAPFEAAVACQCDLIAKVRDAERWVTVESAVYVASQSGAVPELVELLSKLYEAPEVQMDDEVRREAARELTRLAQEMGMTP